MLTRIRWAALVLALIPATPRAALIFNGSTSGTVTVGAPAIAGTTTFTLPGTNGTNGFVLTTNGSGVTSWAAGGGSGTVTSVTAASSGGTITLSGTNPVTTSGTINFELALGHANTWSGQQTFVAPILGTPASGSAANLTSIPVANATGILPAANGGAGAITGALKGNGSGLVSQAACSDLSNGATGCSTATGTSGATVPLLNGTNVWSGQQSVGVTTLTISTATFTPTGATNNYQITMTSACPCTLANPSATPVAGTSGQIVVIQDGTGSRTFGTWGSQYYSSGGTSTITLSTAANAIDVLSYYVMDATHVLLSPVIGLAH